MVNFRITSLLLLTIALSGFISSSISFSFFSSPNFPVDNFNPVSESSSTIIPLKRAGNLLLIDGEIDGISGTFVFDTGAPGLVLNATYFRDGKKTYDATGSGITGQGIMRQTKRISTFTFAGITYNKLTADVIDLGHIENSKGIKILGLIGTKFFRSFEVIIDIRNSSMRLFKVDKHGNRLNNSEDSTKYNIVQKISIINNAIITNLPVGGKNVCFCIDTGAEQNVIDHSNPNQVLETISITRRTHLVGASSERLEILYGIMRGFSIDKHKFAEMPVVIADLGSLRAGFGVNIRGMLGFSFLEQGIVCLNFNKEILSMALN